MEVAPASGSEAEEAGFGAGFGQTQAQPVQDFNQLPSGLGVYGAVQIQRWEQGGNSPLQPALVFPGQQVDSAGLLRRHKIPNFLDRETLADSEQHCSGWGESGLPPTVESVQRLGPTDTGCERGQQGPLEAWRGSPEPDGAVHTAAEPAGQPPEITAPQSQAHECVSGSMQPLTLGGDLSGARVMPVGGRGSGVFPERRGQEMEGSSGAEYGGWESVVPDSPPRHPFDGPQSLTAAGEPKVWQRLHPHPRHLSEVEESVSTSGLVGTAGLDLEPMDQKPKGSGGGAFEEAAGRSTAEGPVEADRMEPVSEHFEGGDAENTGAVPYRANEGLEEMGQEEADTPSDHGPEVAARDGDVADGAAPSGPSARDPEAMLPASQLEMANSDESKPAANGGATTAHDENHNIEVNAAATDRPQGSKVDGSGQENCARNFDVLSGKPILDVPPASGAETRSTRLVRPDAGSQPQSAEAAQWDGKRHLKLSNQTMWEPRSGQASPSRPRSAAAPLQTKEKLQERVRQQILLPVPRWNVAQVSDWVAVLGLPQYRKRFMHQCISGPVLLKLNHSLLKAELGIGVLGHREALLAAIQALPRTYDDAVVDQRWAAKALPDSPESKAKLHRLKLLRELEKAEAHRAALNSKLMGTAHQAELAEGDILHIRGAILDLERQFHLECAQPGGRPGDGHLGVDTQGIIPWHPPGAPFGLTIPKVEQAAAERSAVHSPGKPRPGPLSRGAAFLDRMSDDLRQRSLRLKEMRKELDSPERRFQDPTYSAKRQQADLAIARRHIKTSMGVQLTDLLSGRVQLASLLAPDRRSGRTGLVAALCRMGDQQPAVPKAEEAPEPARSPSLSAGDPQSESAGQNTAAPLRQTADGPREEASNGPLQQGGEGADSQDSVPIMGLQPMQLPPAEEHRAAEDEGISGVEDPRGDEDRGERTAASAVSTQAGEERLSLGDVLSFLATEAAGSLGMTASQGSAVARAKTEDGRLQRFVAAIKEARFMARYENDVRSRGKRRVELRKHWHEVETQPARPPSNQRQRLLWKAPLTQDSKDAADAENCRLLFSQAGWPAADFLANDGRGADIKLAAILQRAQALAAGELFKVSQGRSFAMPEFDDGLDEIQALFLEAKAAEQEEAEAAAAQQLTSEPSSAPTAGARLGPASSSRSEALRAVVQRTASSSSSAYVWERSTAGMMRTVTKGQQEGLDATPESQRHNEQAELAARTQQALSKILPRDAQSDCILSIVVRQLAKCHKVELARLADWTGLKKQLAVYRALTMRRFLDDVEADTLERAQKAEAALRESQRQQKKLSKEEADAFFARLQADGERRKKSREEAIRLAAEQEEASMEMARKRLVGDLQEACAKLGKPASGDAPKRPQSAVQRPPSTAAFRAPARPASARLAGRI